LIKLNRISFSYKKGEPKIIATLSLEIKRGDIVAILGPNGGGKSTLVKLINRSLIVNNGSVVINGEDINKLSRSEIAKLIAVVPQQIESIFPFTVYETIKMGSYLSSDKSTDKIDEIMRIVGITYLKNRLVNELSGGERQLVFVARALIQDSKILILDEATSNLDINHESTILRVVKQLAADRGLTVIAIIHNINLATQFCKSAFFINRERYSAPININDAVSLDNLSEYYTLNRDLITIDNGNVKVRI